MGDYGGGGIKMEREAFFLGRQAEGEYLGVWWRCKRVQRAQLLENLEFLLFWPSEIAFSDVLCINWKNWVFGELDYLKIALHLPPLAGHSTK